MHLAEQQGPRQQEAIWQSSDGAILRMDYCWLRNLACSSKGVHQVAAHGHARGQLHGLAHQGGQSKDIFSMPSSCTPGADVEHWLRCAALRRRSPLERRVIWPSLKICG